MAAIEIWADDNTWFEEDDDPLALVIARGHEDGSLDARLPGVWTGTVVWTSLFAAHLVISSGSRTWHEAADLLIHTLTHGIAGRAG